MIPLSVDTDHLVDRLFTPAEGDRIRNRLLAEVSENIPDCEHSSPEAMERIRFSVLRLIQEGRMKEDAIFALAYTDWRDLFMAADHGLEVKAHEKWAKRMLDGPTNQGLRGPPAGAGDPDT